MVIISHHSAQSILGEEQLVLPNISLDEIMCDNQTGNIHEEKLCKCAWLELLPKIYNNLTIRCSINKKWKNTA